MEVNLINKFLIKKKYSILDCFISENVNYLKNDIDLIHSYLIKNNYMMFCCNFNKKITNKKKFLFSLVKINKPNHLIKSIMCAYLIYFFILAKIDQKIYLANENIRKQINVDENEILIEKLIISSNKLSFKTINFSLFFDESTFIIENHLN